MMLFYLTMDKQSNNAMNDINRSLITLQQREQGIYAKILNFNQQNWISTQTGDIIKQIDTKYPRLHKRIILLNQLKDKFIYKKTMRSLRNKWIFLYSGASSK